VIEPEIESGKGGYSKGSKGTKGGYGKGTTRKLPYAEPYKTGKTTKSKTAKNDIEGTCPANGEPCAIGEGTCKCSCYTGPGGFENIDEYGARL
jgi:hypothetical protein